MNFFPPLFSAVLGAGLTLATAQDGPLPTLYQPENPNQNLVAELVGHLGLNGTGIELGYYPHPNVNLNVDVVAAVSGFRLGGGARLFANETGEFSPFIALDGFVTTGVSNLVVTVNEDKAEYRISPAKLLIPSMGIRYALLNFANVYGTVGYAFALTGGDAAFVAGDYSESVDRLANFLEPDGLQIMLGVSWRFTGR